MHLSKDQDFLTNLLGNSSAHAQQDSDPNSSGSDLDGSALVYSSDSDDAGTMAVWWISHIISPPALRLPPSEFDLPAPILTFTCKVSWLNIQGDWSVISPTDLVACISYPLLAFKYCDYSFGGSLLAFLNLTSDLGLCD